MGEDDFITAIRTVGFGENNREYGAVWDKNGKLHCVAMGRKGGGSVQFEHPLNGATNTKWCIFIDTRWLW